MNDPDKRKTAFEGIIAFSLAALSLGATAPGSIFALPLVVFAASIGCNWASNLIERGYHALMDNQFIDDKDLNHDIARVLTDAFKEAVQQMERSWHNSPAYSQLQQENNSKAKYTLRVLGWMRDDTSKILATDTAVFDFATGNQTVLHLLHTHRNDRQQAETETKSLLDAALETYFQDCDPRLKTFFWQHFPSQWQLRFREKLKDPGNQGTKAWRAYQLVWHERIMGNLNLLNEHITEILIKHRAAECLDETDRHALRDKLLACPAIKNRDTRTIIVKALQMRIPISIPRHGVEQIDVATIVNTCLAYPFGIEHLIQVVLAYEDDTNAIQPLEVFLWQLTPVLGIGNIALLKHLSTLEPHIASIDLHMAELDTLFRASCPHVGSPFHGFDESDTLICMLFDLARQGISHTNTHPLLEFVNRLAAHPQAIQVREQLNTWCAETSQCLCLEPLAKTVPEPPSKPNEAKTWLQVVLEPDKLNPQKVQVQAWVVCENDTEDPPSVYVSDAPQSLDEVATTFDQILGDAYDLTNTLGELSAIEFFLDSAMLYHNVDHWECLDEDGEPYTVLGIEHTVIVRSRERMVAPPPHDEKKRQSWKRQWCLWEKKWSRLEAYMQGQESIPDGAIDLIDHTDDCSKQALRARLIGDDVVCVFSTFRPDSKICKTILNVGIPVMLCPSEEAIDHQSEAEVGTLLKALRLHIQSHGLADVYAHVHAERRKAFQDSREMRPGRFITFLWDDFSRLPPIAEAPPKAIAPGKRVAHSA